MKALFGVVVGAVGVLVVGAVVYYALTRPEVEETPIPTYSVTIGGSIVRTVIADSPAERERGLSGRRGLAPDEGMLFVFPQTGRYSFWMKDMLFPIDIVWISETGMIVDIASSVAPETYPSAFTSQGPARYVLELPAGFTTVHHVRIGDYTELKAL